MDPALVVSILASALLALLGLWQKAEASKLSDFQDRENSRHADVDRRLAHLESLRNADERLLGRMESQLQSLHAQQADIKRDLSRLLDMELRRLHRSADLGPER